MLKNKNKPPVFYLKINRWEMNTRYCFRFWLRVINSRGCDFYIVCDKPEVKQKIKNWVQSEKDIKFIKSDRKNAKKIADKFLYMFTKNWLNPCYAHITPLLHAKKHNIESFWNIDADDTTMMLPQDKIIESFDIIEKYALEHNFDGFSYDMHRSNSKGKHWSFGVSFQTNTDNWINALEKLDTKICEKKIYSPEVYNLDWIMTYLKNKGALNLQSFCINNMFFYHAYAPLVNGPYGLSIHKENIVEYPVMKEIFKMNHIDISYVPIVEDVVKFDFGLTEEESREVMKYHWGGITD